MFSNSDIFRPYLQRILVDVKGSDSFFIIPFLLINIFITKLLGKSFVTLLEYRVSELFPFVLSDHVYSRNYCFYGRKIV